MAPLAARARPAGHDHALAAAERQVGDRRLVGHRARQPQRVAQRRARVLVGPHPAAAERRPADRRVDGDDRVEAGAAPAPDEHLLVVEPLEVAVDRGRSARARSAGTRRSVPEPVSADPPVRGSVVARAGRDRSVPSRARERTPIPSEAVACSSRCCRRRCQCRSRSEPPSAGFDGVGCPAVGWQSSGVEPAAGCSSADAVRPARPTSAGCMSASPPSEAAGSVAWRRRGRLDDAVAGWRRGLTVVWRGCGGGRAARPRRGRGLGAGPA